MCVGGCVGGEVVDIERMTKNQNQNFSFFLFWRWRGWGLGRAGQGEVLAGGWEQLHVYSYVAHCINLIHIAFNFHQDIL